MLTASDVVSANVAAYNARDLDAFMRAFDPEIEMFELHSGERTLHGLAQVRDRYGALFAASPALHTQILHRAVVGELVCDHELVTGRAGGDVEIAITYQVRDGKIRRVWAARAPAGDGVVPHRAVTSPTPMRIALAALPYPETPDASVAHAVDAIAAASRAGAAIVAFPECYVPGYRGLGYAPPPPDPAFLDRAWSAIASAAAASRVAVVLGTERIAGDGLRATVLVIDEHGRRLGFQDKVQLDPTEEGTYAPASAADRRVFAIAGTTIGVVICHEGWRYPETVRFAARRGAAIVFHPQFGLPEPGATTPTRFADPTNSFHEKAILCRAAENTCFFASVNYALPHSPIATAVASPDGIALAHQPYDQPGLLLADLDLAAATGLLASRHRG